MAGLDEFVCPHKIGQAPAKIHAARRILFINHFQDIRPMLEGRAIAGK
jgi:hypothetical protein